MAVAVTKAGHSNAQITTLSTQTHWFQLPCPLAPCPALAPLEVTAALLQFELQPPWPLEGNLDCQLDQLLQDCSLPCFIRDLSNSFNASLRLWSATSSAKTHPWEKSQ